MPDSREKKELRRRLATGGRKKFAKSYQQSLDCANLDKYYFVHNLDSHCMLNQGVREMFFDITVV